MSELNKIALLTSHMCDLKMRLEALVEQQMQERYETQGRIEQLQTTLWEKEAALNDAEREVLFVKNTAVCAIRKLGASIRERDELISKVNCLQQEKDALCSSIQSLQQRLISLAKKHSKPPREGTNGARSKKQTVPSVHIDDSDWEAL